MFREKQYKDQFTKWKWSKHIKKKDWAVIVRKETERTREGKKSEAWVGSQKISSARITRYMNDQAKKLASRGMKTNVSSELSAAS